MESGDVGFATVHGLYWRRFILIKDLKLRSCGIFDNPQMLIVTGQENIDHDLVLAFNLQKPVGGEGRIGQHPWLGRLFGSIACGGYNAMGVMK